mgnify:CR=1 FL=1
MSKTIPAHNFCNSVFDGTHDTPKPCENGHPLILSKNIQRNSINLQDTYNISEEDYNAINARSKVSQWDILFSMIGTVGSVYLEKSKDIPYAIKNMGVFSTKDELKAKWLYYYLQTNEAKSIISNYLNGAVQKFLPLGFLREFPVREMPRNAKEIISVLENIDSKIDNNNAIAAELEGMAKDLYDYWFVQFDFPDENGKPYKSSGGKMVWNEELKREIPEGWEVSQLKDICFLRNGINYDKNEVGDADFKIANVRNITASTFLMDVNDFDVIHLKKEKAKQYSLKPEDIVIARSGTPGAIRLVQNPKNDTIFCGFIICCTPKVAKYRNYMAYTLKLFEGTSATKTGGSILQNVSQDTLNSLILCIPPDELIEKFNIMITSILEEIQNTINESRELTSLRDFLLPMLMNGQVKVKGA